MKDCIQQMGVLEPRNIAEVIKTKTIPQIEQQLRKYNLYNKAKRAPPAYMEDEFEYYDPSSDVEDDWNSSRRGRGRGRGAGRRGRPPLIGGGSRGGSTTAPKRGRPPTRALRASLITPSFGASAQSGDASGALEFNDTASGSSGEEDESRDFATDQPKRASTLAVASKSGFAVKTAARNRIPPHPQ